MSETLQIEHFEELDEDFSDFYIENEKELIYNNLITNSEKKFRITKFEKAKIIGIRATQLASGINTVLSTEDLKDINIKNTLEIAEKEFKQGLIPIIIKRKYANGKKKYIEFNEQNFYNLDL